jgi:hypothetical protein
MVHNQPTRAAKAVALGRLKQQLYKPTKLEKYQKAYELAKLRVQVIRLASKLNITELEALHKIAKATFFGS